MSVRARGIHAIAAAEPDRPALVSGGETITFGALDRAINHAAHLLGKHAIRPGDRVAVLLRNRPEVYVVWNAITRLGGQVVPVSYRAAPPELAYVVSDSGARALVHDDPALVERAAAAGAPAIPAVHVDALGGERPEPSLPDYVGSPVSWMMYTSGTTGRPKGIERPPPRPASEPPPNPYLGVLGLGGDDVHLLTGPAYHTAPAAWSQMSLFEGAAVVVMTRFDATECLRLIAAHRVTASHMVPANFVRILELPEGERARFDLSSVRRILHAAAPCPVAVKRQVIALFPASAIWEYYGASEGMGTLISPEEWLEKPGSVGRPFPGLDVRILDDDGRELPAGEVGTIYIQPFRGFEPRYHNAPDKTRDAYQGELFTVGDLGWKDEDGYLFIADRRTDLILRGGVNVYPAEVESALAEHPDVVDSAVVGVPDPRLGQRVRAVVELRRGATRDAEAIRAFLAERIADYKVPAEVLFVDELPREPSGKVRKRDLVER